MHSVDHCHRIATGQEMVRGENSLRESGKMGILKKSQGKLIENKLILLKAGRSIWGHCDLSDTFP